MNKGGVKGVGMDFWKGLVCWRKGEGGEDEVGQQGEASRRGRGEGRSIVEVEVYIPR